MTASRSNVGARAAITTSALDHSATERILRSVEDDASGAVVLFSGNVRNHHQGRSVAAITYTAYEAMAQQRLERIVAELSTATVNVAIHHRIGRLVVGESSVVIAAASPHREEAYVASRQALERLKAEVPIWKREHYADGQSRWREEEALD